MIEHSSLTYDAIVARQQRIDRANERRRFIAEHPERVVRRENPVLARVRGWFGSRRADAAAPAAGSAGSRVPCDEVALGAQAR